MTLSITELPQSGWEHLYRCIDDEVGLRAFVAIHNTRLGPAVGGTRFYAYENEDAALNDVLNLSASMTSKCAIAGIKKGGGKGVIIGDPKTNKSHNLLTAYAEVIGKLQGKFFTGEDVGMTEADVQHMLTIAPYFIGKTGVAGDPSGYAALSVYTVMKAAAKKIFGTESLEGKGIGVKGVGKVGFDLIKLLDAEGAEIIATDIDPKVLERAQKLFPNIHTPRGPIEAEALDMYAPCAMGNEFTSKNIDSLSMKIICGGANNQIIEPGIEDRLQNKGILYVPDYLANAGGLIDVADELEQGGYKHERVVERIKKLAETFSSLYEIASQSHSTLGDVTKSRVSAIIGSSYTREPQSIVLESRKGTEAH